MTLAPPERWLAAAQRLCADPGDPAERAWLRSAPALPDLPASRPPADLAARPAPLPATAWHATRLIAQAASGDASACAYHARWLWHLLAPADPAGWPLISVVIPAYRRHELLQEAVASVLASGYPRLELCICDDASPEDPLPLLAHLGPRLRYTRLAVNGGASVARQTALELATGELVRFLDVDDLLLPGGLADEVAALAAVPDAELCFTALRQVVVDDKGVPPVQVRAIGRPHCASQEGGLAMVRALPFLPSAVLVARHRMLAVGFDRSLRFHEDRLAFAQLGLAGIKCVGLRQPRAVRRWLPSSASRTLSDTLGQQVRVNFMLLAAALEQPAFWPACGTLLANSFQRAWGSIADSRRPEQLATLEGLLQRLAALAAAPPAGLSAAPLLADLAAALERVQDEEDIGEIGRETLRRLRAEAAVAAEAAAPGPADLALWREASDPATVAGALGCLFAAASRALRRGEAWGPLAQLDQRPFRSIPHPAKARWKLLARLARRLGEPAARLAARRLG